MSHGLLLWLENIDRRRNEVVPIAPKVDRETLRAHHKTLTVLLLTTSFVLGRFAYGVGLFITSVFYSSLSLKTSLVPNGQFWELLSFKRKVEFVKIVRFL